MTDNRTAPATLASPLLTDEEIGEAFDAANEAIQDRIGRMYYRWHDAPPADPRWNNEGDEPFIHRFHRYFAREIEKRIAGRTPTLRAPEVGSERGEIGMDYPTAARSIALNLAEFCDQNLAYPDMIATAARRARVEIESLRAPEVTDEDVERVSKALHGQGPTSPHHIFWKSWDETAPFVREQTRTLVREVLTAAAKGSSTPGIASEKPGARPMTYWQPVGPGFGRCKHCGYGWGDHDGTSSCPYQRSALDDMRRLNRPSSEGR